MNIINQSCEARHLHRELAEFRADAAAAVPSPPATNRGGTSILPPMAEKQQKTIIDWLAFTSPVGIVALRVAIQCLFPDVKFQDQNKGIPGYPSSYLMTVNSVPVGIIGFGAIHGKDYVSITGTGCGMWSKAFYAHVRQVVETVQGKITRLDIAMDFYRGEVSFEQCTQAYDGDEFKLPKSPKSPMQSLVGKTQGGEKKINMGRTMYVGSRKGAKYVRCYEKGLEVFAKMPEAFQLENTEPGSVVWGLEQGAPPSTIADQWLRVEIEFKPDQVLLSHDMIDNGDMYFAGAYPFTKRILECGDGCRPESLKQSVDIDFWKMVGHARNGYGNFIHSLRKIGYDSTRIVELLDTGRHNQRLVRSGILSRLLSIEDSNIPF